MKITLFFILQIVKGVNFYGSESDYIISGSDCGQVFFWEKSTQQIVNVLKGDEHGIVRFNMILTFDYDLLNSWYRYRLSSHNIAHRLFICLIYI